MKPAWGLIFSTLVWPAQAADTAEPVPPPALETAALETTAAQPGQSMLGMLREIETLKAEVAKLRGLTEVQAHQLDTLDKRQTDLYTDLDQRVTELAKAAKAAPVVAPVAPPGAAITAAADTQAETAAYEAALKLFREDDYTGAIADFKAFLKTWPDSALAPNAQYWIGYAYFGLKDYKTSLAHQQKLIAAYPASNKVPDAMLNIATNQLALKNVSAARKTLEQLVAKYPGTSAATLASKRLAALK